MFETATEAMQIVLDHKDSQNIETQGAIQKLIALVEQKDSSAFNYLGTLLLQTFDEELVAYTLPYFLQAFDRIQRRAEVLGEALAVHREQRRNAEKEFQHLQEIKTLHILTQNAHRPVNNVQITTTTLSLSELSLRQRVSADLEQLAMDYPDIFTK